ncbi:MAG: ABC transporter permease [Lentisphaeria bacterium]|nr:ABC transporter permease [Lentisphaeria bacterium]NQZ71290.1 ABC transporter permease [Lentisphaeria bacterium]
MYALIRLEIKKIVSQKKSWMGLVAILIINALFTLGFVMNNQKRGQETSKVATDFLVSDFMNASFFTQTILGPALFLIFPMLIAIIAAHTYAGEFEIGSIRMVLMRPVSRFQVLMSKFITVVLYSIIMLILLGVLSYIIGTIFLNKSDNLIIPAIVYDIPQKYGRIFEYVGWEGHKRIILSYLFSIPMLMSISAMAIMFASLTRHFTSAAILTTTLYFSSYIVGIIPFLSSIHPYLPTTKWAAWKYVLIPEIPWDVVLNQLAWSGGYTAVFLGIASALFYMRDV